MSTTFNPQVEELLHPQGVVALAPEIFNLNTLAYWRHIGSGPRFAKIGRRVVYRKSDVVAWIDAAFNEGGAA